MPIKSFQLELIATDFIQQSPWRLYDFYWFDWLIRDFFAYLDYRASSHVTIPGSSESISLGDEWRSRCLTAYRHAAKACEYEKSNLVEVAGDEWQKVFGTQIRASCHDRPYQKRDR